MVSKVCVHWVVGWLSILGLGFFDTQSAFADEPKLLTPEDLLGYVMIFDVDGTLNDNGERAKREPEVLFRTYIRLRMIEAPNSPSSPNPNTDFGEPLPRTIDVTYAEYEEIKRMLAKKTPEGGIVNVLKPVTLKPDPIKPNRPTQIIPGFYYIGDEAWDRHRADPSAPEGSHFVTDYREARMRKEASQNPREHWAGSAFPIFAVMMSDVRTSGNVRTSTLRGHLEAEYHAWMRAMHQDKEMHYAFHDLSYEEYQRLPPAERPVFYGHTTPESRMLGLKYRERKFEAVRRTARQWVALPPQYEVLSPELSEAKRGVLKRMHTIVYFEDSHSYLREVGELFKELSSQASYRHRIKFVLVNLGPEADVRDLEWSTKGNRITVFDSHFTRPPMKGEFPDLLQDIDRFIVPDWKDRIRPSRLPRSRWGGHPIGRCRMAFR